MRTSLVTLSLLSTALIACGDDPPPPDELRERIADDLGNVLREGKAAADGSTAALPTAAAFSLLTASVDDTTTARIMAPLSRFFADKDFEAGLDEEEGGFDPDAIVKYLNEELFTDANYLGDGIYRVPASMVCEDSVYDPDTGTTSTIIDPECAANLLKIDLRVRVAEDDGLRFWIQLDANHDEPLGFLLRHDELAVTVNLDDATDAMIALSQMFGQQAPNADLSGQMTASLQIIGAAHAKVTYDFDRAIAIKVADQGASLDGPNAYRFTSAQAQVFAIELDGHGTKGSFDLGLGETTAHLPATDTDPSITEYFLGGATANATFQANTLTVNNISLGNKTTTVTVDGQQALAVDLNPNDGRKLNATITADPATGSESISVSPRLDLQHSVDHLLLGDEPPRYDTTRVLLDGALRSRPLSDQVEVTAGSFSITTNPAEYGFSAGAGQCVSSDSVYDSTTYETYTLFSVGACL